MCGIIGIVSRSKRQIASDMYFGLYALQHRGKESAGMVTIDDGKYYSHKGMGEIPGVFDKGILSNLPGSIGIAHNRYSTTAESDKQNIQPIRGIWGGKEFWIVHNGNLVNTEKIIEQCLAKGRQPYTSSDTGAIATLISMSSDFSFEGAVKKAVKKLEGAFSFIILYNDRIIAIRDKLGIRPLCLGKRKDGFLVASESCAIHHMGGTLIRGITPGEMLVINKEEAKKYYCPRVINRKHSIYEFIYFSRPDSIILGRRVRDIRMNMGRLLAKECPVDADIVIPIPDSGTCGGIGFIEESKIADGQSAILRTHLVSRTFIEPIQELREKGVDLKFVIYDEDIKGKKIVLIDDSIVRGTTMKRLIKFFRDAKAKEVHARIFSPPYRYPCYYGVDTYRVEDELIAKRKNGDVEEIRKELGLDSLGYLSLDSAIKAVIETPCITRTSVSLTKDDFCSACFSGKYPVELPKK